MKYAYYGLVAAALAACDAQPPARKPGGPGPHAHQPAHYTPAASPTMMLAAGGTSLPDSLRAFLGVRPLRFQFVRAADLAFWRANPAQTDTVADGLLVVHELHETPRILYRPLADPTRWLQFRPEPVGAAGTWGPDLTVDAVPLDSSRRVLRLRLHGHYSTWGGSLDHGQVALIDITAQPLLLLKTETNYLSEDYGRLNDSVADDKAAGHVGREQAVRVAPGLVVVGPPTRNNRYGWYGRPRRSPLPPGLAAMLPAGRYRYQQGRMQRLPGQQARH